MEARNKLTSIYQSLQNTEDKSLFGCISPIHFLSQAPSPLNTVEMHVLSGKLIRQAQREVLLSFYKYSAESDGGMEIYNALEDLKIRAEHEKTKINICILINSRGKAAELFYKRNSSVEALEKLASKKSEYFNIKLTLHHTTAFGALNTKMIIVDADKAIIRGGDPEDSNNLSRNQIETATLLHGPIVTTMRHDYNSVWFAYCNEHLEKIYNHIDLQYDAQHTPSVQSPQIPCLYISKQENENPWSYYYYYAQGPYKIALLQAISEAKQSINIMTSNLNDRDICDALANACTRNVAVNIITGKYHNQSNESWLGGTNFESMAYLTSKTPLQYHRHLSIRWATNKSGDLVYHGDACAIHAKYVCIDDELVFTGSSPLDKQAMYYSREADIIFLHKATASSYNGKFFNEKFIQGKDYFREAYFAIKQTIQEQAKRIHRIAITDFQKDKYIKLIEVLTSVSDEKFSYRKKTYHLIERALPILQTPTGMIPLGMPESYTEAMDSITLYGLDKHFTDPSQPIRDEKEELIRKFYFIPSSSKTDLRSVRRRTLSESDAALPENESGEKPAENYLRHSI